MKYADDQFDEEERRVGPLHGIKGIEIGGTGPVPFCAMMLADLGAQVLKVDRTADVDGPHSRNAQFDFMSRGRQRIAVDLKHPDGVDTILRLVDQADVLMEGFRPGVMERLGLGPDTCQQRNPKLVYGRMTGYSQTGPLAHTAGHDINYIAMTGVLHAIGRADEPPVVPLNLIADFGGGGMLLAFGVLAALLERQHSGKGQVIDAAMIDGASALMTSMHGLHHRGVFSDLRGTNLNDSGAHFCDTYECADGKFVAVGPIEPKFYAGLIERLGLNGESLPRQMDRASWPDMRVRFAAIFKTRTRDSWCADFSGAEVCVTPVLSMAEAYQYPHHVERETFVESGGYLQPAPAPRFNRTPGAIQHPPRTPGENTVEALAEWGFGDAEIAKLRESHVIR